MQDSQAITVPTEPGTPFAGGFYAGRLRVGDVLYALIVAPKDRGYSSGKWLGTAARTTRRSIGTGETLAGLLRRRKRPSAGSYCDGLANTNALAEAGSPIANWARGLAIGDYTDWYVPSRDELELLYRAFKPTTVANFCSFRDGDNASSVPPGYPYTAAAPAQTPALAFQAGGDEALEPIWYWSSTQYSRNFAFSQHFDVGYQDDCDKSYEGRVRAVRRFKVQ